MDALLPADEDYDVLGGLERAVRLELAAGLQDERPGSRCNERVVHLDESGLAEVGHRGRRSGARDRFDLCLHCGGDLYKWALKLGPLVPFDLLLDCFDLAREGRTTDMQASPYDVTTYGLEPVAIETPDGKAAYVRRQRAYAARGKALRARLLSAAAVVTS